MNTKTGYKITEIGEIPEEWQVIALGKIAREVKSKNDSKEKLAVFAVTKHSGLVPSLKYFKKRVYSQDLSKYKVIKRQQFAYSPIHLNEGAIGLLETENKGLVSPIHIIFEFLPEANPHFFKYLLKSHRFLSIYSHLPQGSVQRRGAILFRDFSKIYVQLPSFKEQNKIASILSDVDYSIQKTDEVIQKTRVLKKGLMQQLLTRGIGHTKFKQTEIGEVPEEWDVGTVEETCEVLDSQRVPLNEETRETMKGNIPYYGANGVVDYVNDYIFNDKLILIAEDGGHFEEYATRPIAYLVTGKCWVNNHAHVLKVKEKDGFVTEYVLYSLEHKNIVPFIKGSTRSKLNQKELRQIPIPIPPLPEQLKIASILLAIDKKIDKENECKKHQEILKEGLMQDLLTGRVRVKVD